jgi:HEAT repeat protein
MPAPAARRVLLLALAAAGSLSAPAGAARAQDDAESGRVLLRAKELLRTGKSSDRKEAIELLIGLDTGPALSCLEDAIQRSASEMEKRAKEVDALDGELADAEYAMDLAEERYPSLHAERRARYLEVKTRWDALATEMRGHLDICVTGHASIAAFRSEAAADRIVRGATSSTSPLARQMYIQALGTPERASRAPVLLELLKAGESRVRAAAVRALRALPPRRATYDVVVPLLKDRCWSVRVGAAEVIARMPLDVAVPPLVEALGRETGEPALQIDSLLRSITGESFAGEGKAWRDWLDRKRESIEAGTFEPREQAEAPAATTEAAFFEIPIESRNLLLVLDLSGSMRAKMDSVDARTAELLKAQGYGDSRLAVALVQSYRMIEGLPRDARINVLAFSEKVTRFNARATAATDGGKKNVVRWLNDQMTGSMTNIWDALRQSFGDHLSAGGATRFEELPDTIVFLTDGVPTAGRFRDERSLADLVGLWNASSGVVVHCVGIGSSYADELMQSISSSTGGYYFDSKSRRLRGERVRPTVPPERRAPGVRASLPSLEEDLRYGSAIARRETVARAVEAAGWCDEGLVVLALGIEDEDPDVRAATADGFASLGARAVGELVRAAGREDGKGRREAIRALGAIGPDAKAAAPALEAIAAGPDADLAGEARRSLERLRAKK